MNVEQKVRIPLAGAQRGLWFLDRLRPKSAVYNIPWQFDITGPVDLAALTGAIRHVAARHDALRSTFALGRTGPEQLIRPRVEIPVAHTDLRDLPAAERARRTAVILDAEAATGFDLESGPLIRVRLVTGSEDRTTMLVVVHHIVWDGWSAGVFERDLVAAYTALAEGTEPRQADISGHYTDEVLSDAGAEDAAEALKYWREQLRGVPTALELPTDRPRGATWTFDGDTTTFALPDGIAARVADLAAAEDATPYTVLLAAFAVLVRRLTGADDLVVGSPVSTRNRPELADLVGYFVTVVPMRVRVRADATFRELLHQVRDNAFDAYSALDAPLDSIIEELGLDRSGERSPLVRVLFGLHDEDPEPLALGGARAVRRVRPNGTSKFDLTWSVYDDGAVLRGEAEYSTDLFDPGTIDRFAEYWRSVLSTALADPDAPVWQLEPVDTAEAVVPVLGEGRCLSATFEEVTDRFPDRPALTCEDRTLTYAGLDARANRLAHALVEAGVRRGDRVGLLLDRTERIVISVLAVHKAGGAYVPVDLSSPADRAAFVFGDTGTSVVITDRPEAVPEGPWRVLDVAGGEPGTEESRLPAVAEPSDIAYVIFTSGSTGTPKGVAVAHEHVSRLVVGANEHFDHDEHDTWTLSHSHAFDVSVFEMWGALHRGCRLVVVTTAVNREPDALAELVERERVSALSLTPSALRRWELALRQRPRPLPALKWIILAGEALEPALVRDWFALPSAPKAVLCNLYGTTETTVHVTTLDVTGAEDFPRSLVGGPMAHLGAAVLDDRLRPCPVGVTGELFISGGSVAHGYWGRASLTAQRFVPDVTGSVPGGRMYRTGDLARRLPDGGLEYLGRADHQVKIRGFRIEPGEVEAALVGHPEVRSAVVVARGDADERALAAYVTTTGADLDQDDVRAHLATSLPEYMVPATVTVLDALPLTVNGKVDRAALPEPTWRIAEHVPPTGAEQLAVAGAWAGVLEVTGIGARDNFFHLGGDSIRAVRVVGGLRERGWAVSVQDVFTAPRLADLAALLRPGGAADELPATRPFDLVDPADRAALPPGVVDAYPMVDMQVAMVFHMELAGDVGNYHNVNSFRLSGELDNTLLRRAIADVTARHPVLRTGLDLSGYSVPLQLVHAEAPVWLDCADLRGMSPDEQDAAVRAVFAEHCETRFDLHSPPLLRFALQHLDEGAHQLTVTEHHAIVDGWSFTSLFTEVLERHAELLADPTVPAAPPPVSTFRDFVALERAAVLSEESGRFWRERLDGVDGRLWSRGLEDVLTDEPRTVEHILPDAAGWLRSAAGAAGVPVKVVALAAHVTALRAVTGRDRVVTGTSMNGRLEQAGGTEACGLFLNTIPLAFTPPPGATWLDLLAALHAEEVAAVAHRRVPFARLARLMADTRLDCNFVYLRFHSLGRLGGSAVSIVDGGIGCEPTMRYERTHFPLGIALVQDPVTERVMLSVEHNRAVVTDRIADDYAEAFRGALARMARFPQDRATAHRSEQ